MIIYCRDANGELWDANDPQAPQQGVCALCAARMYHRTSALGHGYYALCPSATHEDDACRTLDGNSDIFSLVKTKPEDIWKHHFPSTEPGGKPRGRGGTGRVTGPTSERVRGMVSLSQLAATGHLECRDCKMNGGWMLSDVSINPNFSYLLFELHNLGKRILQGKPQFFYDATRTIRLKLYIGNDHSGRAIHRLMILDLVFEDEEVYLAAKSVLFEEQTQSTKWRRRYERVAIVGDWTHTSRGACRCGWGCDDYGWSCIGHLVTRVDSINRIYVFPATKIDPDSNNADESNQ